MVLFGFSVGSHPGRTSVQFRKGSPLDCPVDDGADTDLKRLRCGAGRKRPGTWNVGGVFPDVKVLLDFSLANRCLLEVKGRHP